MKFISLAELAQKLNVNESAITNEITQVLETLPTNGVYYFLANQNSPPKILAVTTNDIQYIKSGANTLSFVDLITNFNTSATEMAWLLKELTTKNLIEPTEGQYFLEVKDKPVLRAWFEPETVTVGGKSTLNIEINSPCEIHKPKLYIEAPGGLEIEEELKTPAKLYKGRFVGKYGFEANAFGEQKVSIGIEGVIDGAFFENQSYRATIKVLPLQPDLVISESQAIYDAVYQGTFRLTFDITNRGAGASQNVALRGLEKHLEFEPLEPTQIGHIASHGSVKYKIALKPRKSGAFSFKDLSISFEDLLGQPFKTDIPPFEIQVATPQPKLRLEFVYPENVEPKRSFPLIIRITNIGEGEAKNITFTLPIDPTYIQSGIVDCNITRLRSHQTEEVIVRLQAPEKASLEVPDIKLQYDDGEDNTNFQKVFGVLIPIRGKDAAFSPAMVDVNPTKWPFITKARIGGQYDIVEEIGEGGFAKVYRVRRLKFNEEWALKALKAEFVTIPSFMESFVEEAKIAQKLREDHIVGVQYVDIQRIEDIEFPYIIMEYIHGGTLRDRLKESLDLMTCAEIIKDMCSALLYAHQQGVIHFDVKPSNIFYDDAKKLWKLGDFGLSKPITTSANITPRGSLQYMAPEVREHRGTSKSDIYSLGRVCAEILTGSPDGDIANADKQYPRESRPKVREYAAIIEKMLNVNPTERPTIVEVKKVFLKSATWTGNEKRRAI
jgi:hypothetical protein